MTLRESLCTLFLLLARVVVALEHCALLAVGINLVPYNPHHDNRKRDYDKGEHPWREVITLHARPHLEHLLGLITTIVHHGTAVDDRQIGIHDRINIYVRSADDVAIAHVECQGVTLLILEEVAKGKKFSEIVDKYSKEWEVGYRTIQQYVDEIWKLEKAD